MGARKDKSTAVTLDLRVYARAIHPDWFAVRAHRRLTMLGWEADVRLVEGGHAVVFAVGDERVSEVLADAQIELPDVGLRHHGPVRRERSASLASGRVQYHGVVEVEEADPEVFSHLCDEIALEAHPGDLFHRGTPRDRLAAAPMSRLHAELRPSGLSVQVVHTYPEARAVVRAQSLYEVGRADR